MLLFLFVGYFLLWSFSQTFATCNYHKWAVLNNRKPHVPLSSVLGKNGSGYCPWTNGKKTICFLRWGKCFSNVKKRGTQNPPPYRCQKYWCSYWCSCSLLTLESMALIQIRVLSIKRHIYIVSLSPLAFSRDYEEVAMATSNFRLHLCKLSPKTFPYLMGLEGETIDVWNRWHLATSSQVKYIAYNCFNSN